MRITRGIILLVLLSFAVGCGRGSSPLPAAPTPATPLPPAVPAPPPAPQTLRGYVADTAFRPMADARIEVLNGPEAGKEMTSDARGAFSYTGTFTAAVSMRASKDGYVTATASVFASRTSNMAWVSFQLTPHTPPIEVIGSYTLTVSADSACAGIPDDVRTRSYAATVTRGSNTSAPANTFFDGRVSGAEFAPYGNLFWVGVAGDYVTVSTEGEGPTIVEQVGPNRYVAFWGSAGASVGASGVTTISAPFSGMIEYCELKSPIGSYYDCSPALAAVREQCTSPNNRLILTRR